MTASTKTSEGGDGVGSDRREKKEGSTQNAMEKEYLIVSDQVGDELA